ncbi:uncharacterized protein [Miscanthus floridulus]|uniref:uncharacterized protein n=1 Tax=Miscanthus floridulus TaxID=154761 RepID=UPI0034593F4B
MAMAAAGGGGDEGGRHRRDVQWARRKTTVTRGGRGAEGQSGTEKKRVEKRICFHQDGFNPASLAHRNPDPFTFHGLTPAAAALVRSSASAPSLPSSSRSRDRPRRSAGVLAQAASPRGSALLLQVQAHVPPSSSSHLIFWWSHGGAALQAPTADGRGSAPAADGMPDWRFLSNQTCCYLPEIKRSQRHFDVHAFVVPCKWIGRVCRINRRHRTILMLQQITIWL